MDAELLTRLLARDEGQFLEFKSAYDRPGDVRLKRRKATEVDRTIPTDHLKASLDQSG